MVSIKSKGGDCWQYDASVVLDGNLINEGLEGAVRSSTVTWKVDIYNIADIVKNKSAFTVEAVSV